MRLFPSTFPSSSHQSPFFLPVVFTAHARESRTLNSAHPKLKALCRMSLSLSWYVLIHWCFIYISYTYGGCVGPGSSVHITNTSKQKTEFSSWLECYVHSVKPISLFPPSSVLYVVITVMDTHSPSPSDQLVDYLLLVGPGKGSIFDTSCPPSSNSSNPNTGWCTIHSPQPTILRSFPQREREHTPLTMDISFFCQPDGCSVELPEQRTHQFMLTDTETNKHTYGICLSFSHLFDTVQGPGGTKGGFSGTCLLESADSVCIQEWGILSVCILSQYPFFTFLHKVLLSLQHFVEHFFGADLTWNALIQHRCEDGEGEEGEGGEGKGTRGGRGGASRAVLEIEKWIAQLLAMRAPQQGQSALEVELEVDPAVMVAVPPINRLPLLDLCVSRLFHRLGVCSVIEIFKLVLAEQKVCVCVFVCLLSHMTPINHQFSLCHQTTVLHIHGELNMHMIKVETL